MRIQALGLWLASSLAAAQSLRFEESQDFPLGSEVENLALRPSGDAVVVVNTSPQIFQVSPKANAIPKPIYTFQGVKGVSSITATSRPDVFFAVAGNFTFATLSPDPGSYAIHRLSFGKRDKVVVEKLAGLDALAQPNGIVNVPGTSYVLIADSRAGVVFRFDARTKKLVKYFDHPLTRPKPVSLGPGLPDIIFGVNGIKLSRGFLYFSNTNQQLVARIKATGKEACLEGEPEIVATQTPVDDFVVDGGNGDVYLASQNTNSIAAVKREEYGGVPKDIFGGPNQTDFLAPTAVVWGKKAVGRTLVATFAGEFSQFLTGNFTGGGKVVSIHLK